MPLGLGTTVDYIFFSAESCENGNRTGKPGGSGFPDATPKSLWELMVGQASDHMTWAAATCLAKEQISYLPDAGHPHHTSLRPFARLLFLSL